MKNRKSQLLYTTFAVASIVCSYGQNPIPLKTALANNQVSLELKSTGQLAGQNKSSHIGKCMAYRLKNKTGSPIHLQLDAGYMFEPDSSLLQPLLFTDNANWMLQASAYISGYLNAMCASLGNESPGKDMKYRLGNSATGVLKKFADLIAAKNYQNEGAQAMLWAITDGADITKEFTTNSNLDKDMRNFAKNNLGIELEAQQSSAVEAPRRFRSGRNLIPPPAKNQVERVVSFRIDGSFESLDTGKLIINICDTLGNVYLRNVTNIPLGIGPIEHVFWINTRVLPPGKWIVKYYNKEKELHRKTILMKLE